MSGRQLSVTAVIHSGRCHTACDNANGFQISSTLRICPMWINKRYQHLFLQTTPIRVFFLTCQIFILCVSLRFISDSKTTVPSHISPLFLSEEINFPSNEPISPQNKQSKFNCFEPPRIEETYEFLLDIPHVTCDTRCQGTKSRIKCLCLHVSSVGFTRPQLNVPWFQPKTEGHSYW